MQVRIAVFTSSDVDGLSLPIVAGERLELRLYGGLPNQDPPALALVADDGTTIRSTAQFDLHTGVGPPMVKRMKDHWRVRHEAKAHGTVHVLLRSPRAHTAHGYVLETERLEGGVTKLKMKKKVGPGVDAPLPVTFAGIPGAKLTGKVVAKGTTLGEFGLYDAADQGVPGTGGWHLEKGGHVLDIGGAWTPVLADEEYTLIVQPFAPEGKAKLKFTLLLTSPSTSITLQDED